MNLVTTADLIKRLGITRQAIHYHIRKGLLGKPAITLGRTQAWTEDQVEDFIAKRRHRSGSMPSAGESNAPNDAQAPNTDSVTRAHPELTEEPNKAHDPFDAPF